MSEATDIKNPFSVKIGPDELVIKQRHDTASIANDFLIAIWFLIGSIFFFFPSLERAAAWLFVIGSFQFIVRPTIRLICHIHLQHIPESSWES